MVNVIIQKEGNYTVAYIDKILFLKDEDASTVIQAVIDEMASRISGGRSSLPSDNLRKDET